MSRKEPNKKPKNAIKPPPPPPPRPFKLSGGEDYKAIVEEVEKQINSLIGLSQFIRCLKDV